MLSFQQILDQVPIPNELAKKFIALQFGFQCVSIDDISQFYTHLDRSFRLFSAQFSEFNSLSTADQQYLLSSNSSILFQLYLTRFFTSTNSLQQLESLLGVQVRKNAAEFEKSLVVMTLSYVSGSANLFHDQIWEEMYDTMLSKFANVPLDDEEFLAKLTSCIVFYNPLSDNCNMDNPSKIAKSFAKYSKALCEHNKKIFQNEFQIFKKVEFLKSMACFYTSHTNIRAPYHEFDENTIENPELCIDEASLLDHCWQTIPLGDDLLEVAEAFLTGHHSPSVSDAIRRVIRKRLEFFLHCYPHPHPVTTVSLVKSEKFVLHVFNNTFASGAEQLHFMMGSDDKFIMYNSLISEDLANLKLLKLESSLGDSFTKMDSFLVQRWFNQLVYFILNYQPSFECNRNLLEIIDKKFGTFADSKDFFALLQILSNFIY